MNRGELDKRFDPFYYKPLFIQAINRIENGIKIYSLAKFIIHPPEYPREYSAFGYQLIRSQNVRPTGIDLSANPVFFSTDFLSSRKYTTAKTNDLLIVRSGVNAGDIATVEQDYNTAIVGADTLLARLTSQVSPKYIQVFFWTDLGKLVLSRYITGATNRHISPENFGHIVIPKSLLDLQVKVIELFENALEQKHQLETQAQALLDSIDVFLLSELGVKLPLEPENTIENRMFKTSWRQVSGGRYDPTFQKVITEFKGSKYPSRRLRDFAQINPATKFKGLQDADEVTFIPMENVSEDGSIDTSLNRIAADSKGYTTFAENDLLVAKITPCMENGKTGVARNLTNQFGYGSTEFHVFRPKSDNLNIDYLHAFFHANFFRQNAKLTFGGSAGHQQVPPEFFKKLYIPLPPTPVQIKIVQEITTRQQQAQTLRQQAQRDFAAAKQDIERLILG